MHRREYEVALRIRSLLCAPAAMLVVATGAIAQQTGALESGRRMFETGQLSEAATLLTPIGATNGEAAVLLCRIAHDERRTNDAVTWGEKAVALLPDSAPAHLWLGRAYILQLADANLFRKPGIAGRARARFDRAAEIEPQNYDVREARTHYYMNAPAIGGGGMGKARAEGEVARKLDPYRGGLLRGDIEHHDKKMAAAEQEFAALVATYPDSSAPHHRLAMILEKRKDSSGALREYQTALRLDPKLEDAKSAIKRLQRR